MATRKTPTAAGRGLMNGGNLDTSFANGYSRDSM
jgi:hypothetical protein